MKCPDCNNELDNNYCKICNKSVTIPSPEQNVVQEKENTISLPRSPKLNLKRNLKNPFNNRILIFLEFVLSILLTYIFFLTITSFINNSYIVKDNSTSIELIEKDSINTLSVESQNPEITYSITHESQLVIIAKRLFSTDRNPLLWIVPYLIVWIFIFLVIDILFKWLIVSRLSSLAKKNGINKIVQQSSNLESVADFNLEISKISRIRFSKVYFKSLISIILYRHKFGIKEGSINENIKQLVDDEAEKSLNSFSLPKLLIWAMPILGFIGTVVGIGLAIGNLSGFLGGDIEDIALVKNELGKIASGLSYAFDTTLLGLVTSLISMVPTTITQSIIISTYSKIELLGEEIIEESEQYNNESFEISSVGIEKSLKAIEKRTNDYSKKLITLDNNSVILATKLDESVKLIESSLEQFQNTIQESILKQNNVVTKLTEVSNTINSQINVTNNGFEELNEINSNYLKTQNDNNEVLKGLTKLISSMGSSQEKITEILTSLDGGFEFKLVRPKNKKIDSIKKIFSK